MKKINWILLVFTMSFLFTLAGCKKQKAEQTVASEQKAVPSQDVKADNSLEELKTRGVFVLGLDDSLPPLGFRDEDSNIVGYDIDLAKEAAARLGVEFKAQPIDWDAKEMELQTGKIDCIWNGLTITEERKNALAFTKPYLKNAQVLIVKNESGITKLADAAGKTIGIQSGSSAQDAVENNSEFHSSMGKAVYFKDNITALNDLVIGGIDCVVMDSVVASYDISVSKKPLYIVEEILSEEEYGIAFRKTDIELRDKIQEILEEMAKDGTVEKISTKWFGSDISVIGK